MQFTKRITFKFHHLRHECTSQICWLWQPSIQGKRCTNLKQCIHARGTCDSTTHTYVHAREMKFLTKWLLSRPMMLKKKNGMKTLIRRLTIQLLSLVCWIYGIELSLCILIPIHCYFHQGPHQWFVQLQ